MAAPNDTYAPMKPLMTGCQQEPCSLFSVRAMRMECQKCGGLWVSPDNAQKLMDQRDKAVMLAGELVAIIRVNTMRGTWAEATPEQVDEFLAPWIAKLRVAQGHSPENVQGDGSPD